jgi:SsrA-binding protein
MAKKDKRPSYHGDGAIVATNRKARHEYELSDKMEAGLVLDGPEVKSIRRGKVSLNDAHGRVKNGEAWLCNMFVDVYEEALSYTTTGTRRDRKLLLHRRELDKLAGKLDTPGCALIPLCLYFKNGRAKIEIAVGRGKRAYDKRQTLKDRDQNRELNRVRKEWRVT